MLGLAEYLAYASQLRQIALTTEAKLQIDINKDTPKLEATKVAGSIVQGYHQDYVNLLRDAIEEVVTNAAIYYNRQVPLEDDLATIVKDIIELQWSDRYYGATLRQRLRVNRARLKRQITQTVQLGPEKLHGLLTNPVPFGAHNNVDRRVLLGTLVKAEQDTARYFAKKGDVPFIRWTLSHRHTKPDECDYLASFEDDRVKDYLASKDLNINPKGLYFSDDLPHPPHPNCQCEFIMVNEEKEYKRTRIRRAVETVRRLLKRIRRK